MIKLKSPTKDAYLTKEHRLEMVEFLSCMLGANKPGNFKPYKPNESDDYYWTIDSANNWKVTFPLDEPQVIQLSYRYSTHDDAKELTFARWLEFRGGLSIINPPEEKTWHGLVQDAEKLLGCEPDDTADAPDTSNLLNLVRDIKGTLSTHWEDLLASVKRCNGLEEALSALKGNKSGKSTHYRTESGEDLGGTTEGVGFIISWQRGALTDTEGKAVLPNGALSPTILAVVMDRLMYQQAGVTSPHTQEALVHIEKAVKALLMRVQEAEDEGNPVHEI